MTVWTAPPDAVDRVLAALPWWLRWQLLVIDFLFAEHPWERRVSRVVEWWWVR